ncbi:MAG: hypothetical protein IPG09_06435 [Ignavibacteria bacterium]|nr:hypothetical protein [Ignavibacteria bacterium]
MYASDDEDAIEIAESLENIHEEAYEDADDSGDSNYDFENIDVECVESDVPRESIPRHTEINIHIRRSVTYQIISWKIFPLS